jgi:acetylornithine deacetylase/succinyl-diaminopimelate desuccinylase-like protein
MKLAVVVALILSAAPAFAQTDAREAARVWVAANQKAIVTELATLLAIPNVAADRANIRRNAEHLRGMLARRGFAAELLETRGNPLVYGELRVPGATRTLLLYSHYDGQPVAPAGWRQKDPFTPVLRSGRVDQGGKDLGAPQDAAAFEPDWRIYARSASDDKSPIVALCAAVDALKARGLQPSANLRVILDGEEEASSPSLVPAIAQYRDKLRADAMIILDGPIHSTGRPTVALGARGIVTFNLTVFGPKAGIHSGNYGNWIPNPAERLASLLASMKDGEGRVLVAGWNDGIAPLTAGERAMAEALPDDSANMLRAFGVAAPSAAYPNQQQALQWPTLNVRGLASAHVGAGARTIIPDRATAAMDIRLVKETTAEAMLEKLRRHVRAQGFHLVEREPDDETRATHGKIARIEVSESFMSAFRTPAADPQASAVIAALGQAFAEPPIVIRTLGGSVPIAPFIEALGFPAFLVPTVNFDNNQHEENENLRIGTFFQAVEIIAVVLRAGE